MTSQTGKMAAVCSAAIALLVLSGCAHVLDKAIYHASAGEKVAGITYNASLSEMNSVVFDGCRKAIAESDQVMTMENGAASKVPTTFVVRVPNGGTLTIVTTERSYQGRSVGRLDAHMKTKTGSGAYALAGVPIVAKGPETHALAGVVGHVDRLARSRGMKKVEVDETFRGTMLSQ